MFARPILRRIATGRLSSCERIGSTQRRLASKSAKSKSLHGLLKAETDTAQRLLNTGHWRVGRAKGEKRAKIDTRRVNIVSEKLCSDIVDYIGPSLERHRGCDLLDLNPGTGLWSRALHDVVQPRKHLMLDLDADFYKPYLADLAAKPNVELLAKSGIVWDDLESVVVSHFTQQSKVSPAAAPPQRNDTLLVTANLSMCPKRPYRGFDNVGTMVLYQFISSIRQSALLQQYGLVRLLVWVNDDDKHRVLPRVLLRRRRSAFEAELSCEWLHEVCGSTFDPRARAALRDRWMDLESAAATAARMDATGIPEPPEHRQQPLYRQVRADPSLIGKRFAGLETPQLERPYVAEFEKLRGEFKQDVGGRVSMDSSVEELHALRDRINAAREPNQRSASAAGEDDMLNRLLHLHYRDRHEASAAARYGELLRDLGETAALAAAGDPDAARREAAWNDATSRLSKNKAAEFARLQDGLHLFRQDPPVLLWDRRAYEPLTAQDKEFFPNAPTALLDIQPKAMHPLLRQNSTPSPPTSSSSSLTNDDHRAGEMSDVLLHIWFANRTLDPAEEALDRLWGGFGSEAGKCPSFRDPAAGGSPVSGLGRVRARTVNERQWVEVMRAWMDWPFRPAYTKLLARWAEDMGGEAEDGGRSGAQGRMF